MVAGGTVRYELCLVGLSDGLHVGLTLNEDLLWALLKGRFRAGEEHDLPLHHDAC